MKNFILFLFIGSLLFLFTGCYKDGTEHIGVEGIRSEVLVKEINYKGHSYIEFKEEGTYGQGWVHNPECLKNDIGELLSNQYE